MVDLFEKAVAAVRKLPATDQEQIARMMLSLAEETNAREDIDPAHLSDIYESLDQAKRGEFASEANIAAAFRRFGA